MSEVFEVLHEYFHDCNSVGKGEEMGNISEGELKPRFCRDL